MSAFFECGSLEKKLLFQFHFQEAKLVASHSADVILKILVKSGQNWSKLDELIKFCQLDSEL